MSVYINGVGCISPQRSFDYSFFKSEPLNYDSDYLPILQPVYKEHINPIQLRRMSKVMKMGVASGIIALKDAGIETPDAIISGTAYGCIEDTEIHLLGLLDNDEKLLTPTSFIQSTHNTINSMIAILRKCIGYNFTYVHRGFSFENAMLDAKMRIENHESNIVLVGGYDEMTDNHYHIHKRLNLWKDEQINSLDLLSSTSPGTLAGQGSAFFLVSGEKSENTYCELKGLKTIFEPSDFSVIQNSLHEFIKSNNLEISDIDVIILGFNGDPESDKWYNTLLQNIEINKCIAAFKHLCGDYQTSSAFAMWLGSNILKMQVIPESVCIKNDCSKEIKNVLIYNHYNCTHHSFILLSR